MLEINKIHQGDCLELMKEIEDNSIDAIIIDPPYNVLAIDWDKDEIDWAKLSEEFYRVLKYNGFVYIFGQTPMIFNVYNEMSKKLRFKQDLIWYKNRGFSLSNAIFTKFHENILLFIKTKDKLLKEFGLYLKTKRKEKGLSVEKLKNLIGMPNLYAKDNGRNIDGGFNFYETGMTYPTRDNYNKIKEVLGLDNSFDSLFDRPTFNFDEIKLEGEPYKYTKNPKHKLYGQINNQKYYEGVNDGKRNPKSVLEYSNIQSGKEYLGHPTQKPLEMIKYLLKSCTNENNIVLDCFMGSGTTAVACKQLGRNFIGIELSKEYCDIANKRLQQEVLK